jgi:opacity protein-like surface antigen
VIFFPFFGGVDMKLFRRWLSLVVRPDRIAIATGPLFLFLACIPVDAVADGLDAGPSPVNWQYETALYGFVASIDGDAGARDVDAEVEVGFDDILENLDFGAMGFFTGRNADWSFVLDAAYLKLSDERANARNVINTALTTSIEVELEQTIVEGFVGRRILSDNGSGSPFRIDAIGGFRYNNIEGEFGARASLLGLTATAERSWDIDWVDPVIGLRGEYWTSDRFRILGWADYGGFGIGADSTWQVAAGVNYLAWDRLSLYALYRAFAFDYADGAGDNRIHLDLTYSGPLVGVGYRF